MSGSKRGWIGVDLDGTVAKYEGWLGISHIGDPIEPIASKIRALIAAGVEVRILTAHASDPDRVRRAEAVQHIEDWTETHLGERLQVTAEKDFAMVELWDDRAKQVVPNCGLFVEDLAVQYNGVAGILEEALHRILDGRRPEEQLRAIAREALTMIGAKV